MGLLDTILGRTKPVRPDLDALFALPAAAITISTSAGLVLSGRAGVCWKPPAGHSAEEVQCEIADLLQLSDDPDQPAGTTSATDTGAGTSAAGPLTQRADSFGYRWLLLADPEPENLVSRVHLVNTMLTEAGWGPQLLCSVFGIVHSTGPDAGTGRIYLVYLYKQGTFYPFVPTGEARRDNELELRIRSLVGDDLPVEQDLSRWFPLWDLPLS